MSFKNIVLGVQRKKYTHNLSFDNNTTMDFGVLQPLLSQYMEPKSNIKVFAKQLVRLAPMPTPSFARMFLRNYATFVKMTDVVPYHECLLSKIPFSTGSSTYTPTKMPFTDCRTLTFFLLSMSKYGVWWRSKTDNTYKPVVLSESSNIGKAAQLAFLSQFNIKLPQNANSLSHDFLQNIVDAESVDDMTFSPLASDYTVSVNNGEYVICFRFNNTVNSIRKQFIGLGYALNMYDTTEISLAPLLAYYKAYYNLFGLTRDLPFETTNCFALVKLIEGYSIDFSKKTILEVASTSSFYGKFISFLRDLGNLYYTDSNSYIAAQRDNIVNKTPLRGLSTLPSQNGVFAPSGTTSAEEPSDVQVPALFGGEYPYLTQLSLDVLKRLSTFVNKDSAIGKRLSDWVKVHYGAEVSNSLFEDAFRLNSWSTAIDIDDVFSTSDTADVGAAHKGDYLGAYAGSGTGFSKSGFSFVAPVHGYCFVLSCIVPITNCFQGIDPTLLGIDLDTIPLPEFDALGFEATPRNVFISDNDVCVLPKKSYSDTFGFVPRYTGFKVKKNVVNGDMSKGFFKTDLLPYFNDRMLYNNTLQFSHTSDGNFMSFSADNVPNASTEFQKICRYAFLGNYNRLFYNSGTLLEGSVPSASYLSDNFIVQTVFDVRVSNWLKPVQNSYDTIDDDVDNNTTSVTTN